MGQTAEPEEKKENMEKTDSASIETPEDTVQDEPEVTKADESAAEAEEDKTGEASNDEKPEGGDAVSEEEPVSEEKSVSEEEAVSEEEPVIEVEPPAPEEYEFFIDEEEEIFADEEDEEDEEEAESLRAWLLFLLVSASLAAVVFGLGFGCTVKKVHVRGNSLYTSEEIAERVISDDSLLRHNTVFLTALYMTPFAPQIPFEESVKVTPVSYDEIRITVKDMDIGGFIPYTGRNLYFSTDGIIQETTPLVLKNATFVTGISVTEAEKGKKMAADNEVGLSMVLEILQTLKKYDLKADCVALTKAGNIVIYFDEIKVQLGKTNFELKLSKISQIYPYLEGRSGTIDLTNYTSADENIILK